jgi:hypothetical protein
MAEFAPARVRRAAQGTAQSAATESGALLFGSFLLGTQEKGTRPPPRRTKPHEKLTPIENSQDQDGCQLVRRPACPEPVEGLA